MSARQRQERERTLDPRASFVSFLVVTALVVVLSVGLVLALDPRTQEWWGARVGELTAPLRALLGR